MDGLIVIIISLVALVVVGFWVEAVLIRFRRLSSTPSLAAVRSG